MATTVLSTVSERAGQVTLSTTVSNITSVADWSESFQLPTGFGDCFIMGLTIFVGGIQTVVAAGDMRGPAIFLVTNTSKDFVGDMPPWRRMSVAAIISQHECTRPVLWRSEELLNMQAFSEDTGAGNTSDVSCIVRVSRMRNQTPASVGSGFTYPQP